MTNASLIKLGLASCALFFAGLATQPTKTFLYQKVAAHVHALDSHGVARDPNAPPRESPDIDWLLAL